jgi:hypothetical protein
MANETYSQMWRALQLHSPPLPTTLAQQFINSRFRDIRRKRLWSWRVGSNQIITPNIYSTGLATATIGSNVVTGTGTAWNASQVGLQFMFGSTAPIYTITEVTSPTSLLLDLPFGGVISLAAPTGYQIFYGYITPPADFQDFLSVKDVLNNYRLQLHLSQEYLDSIDAQRATRGNAYGIADFRYASSPTLGSVSAVAVAVGSNLDPAPVTFGTYTGMTDSIFVFTVTTGGLTGTALFSWSKDNGTVNTNTPTTSAGFLLQEGVMIQWPAGVVYVPGDVFVSKVRPGYAITGPQYELWPYNMSARVYPFLYDKRFPDLNDPNGLVPPFIDPDVLVKGALADVCRWKGTVGQANPMYGLDIAMSFEKEFQAKVAEMEREDDEVYCADVRYQMESFSLLEYAPFPYGADWAQSHAVGAG